MKRTFLFCLILITLSISAMAEKLDMASLSDLAELDLAYIRSGALVTNFLNPTVDGIIARYTGTDLGASVKEVTCRARFYGGGAVALISGPIAEWSVDGITTRSIHAVFTSDGYHFGFFEDGRLTDVLADPYTLDLTGQTEYSFGYTISGTTITLQLPNGKKITKRDDRVKTCNGSRVIYEHYLTAENVAEQVAPEITYIRAKGGAKPTLKDDFQRADGLPASAPSGHIYAQFRNEYVYDL